LTKICHYLWYFVGLMLAVDLLKLSSPYDPRELVLCANLALTFLWVVWAVCFGRECKLVLGTRRI